MNAGDGQNATAVRRQLVQLVAAHGPGLLDDSRRVRAMLADAVAGATAEANLIGLALSSGVPAKLRDASRDPARAGTAVAETTAHLQQTSSVQAADAQWAVAAIAEALGLASVSGTASPESRQRPEPMTAGPAVAAGPNDLVVRVAGQERVVSPGSVVTIGRDPASTIVLESSVVSRNHARIQSGVNGWEYVDLDSTQGSFVDGSRVRTHTVRSETTVTMGQGSDALVLRLAPFGRANTALPPDPARGGRAPATEVPLRPGGALGHDPSARTEVGGGGAEVLRVTLGGATTTVAASGSLSIGRETDNDLVASASTVSRHHVRIESADGGWRLRDLGSTSGTWLDGKRVADVPLAGRQQFVLGDPTKGDQMTTEAPGTAPAATAGSMMGASSGRRGPLLIGAAAVAIFGVIGAGYLVSQNLGDDEPGNTSTEVAEGPSTDELANQLAKGTVRLSWSDANGGASGSGTVIDKDLGLILTNAHVVAPAAVGSNIRDGYTFFSPAVKNPSEIEVFLSEGIGKPAQPRFTAKVVAADGYLDLAVLKIDKTTVGTFLEEEDLATLTEIPIGDSESLNPTDEMLVVGYPGAQDSMGPTYSPSVVSGWSGDERIGTNRAFINSAESISLGNSGGLAANQAGELVGVPSLIRIDNFANEGRAPDRSSAGSAIRPVNLALPLIKAATEGTKYASPYAEARPRGADIIGVRPRVLAEPGDPGSISARCNYDTKVYPNYAFGVRYEGFTGNQHTDVIAVLTDPVTGELLDYSLTQWTTKMPAKGCMTITTNLTSLPPGGVVMTIAVGGDLVPLYRGTIQ